MQFLFIESNEKPLYLVCQERTSVMKEYNLKRHYKSQHEAKYDNIRGQECEDKIKQLIKTVCWQQIAITRLWIILDCAMLVERRVYSLLTEKQNLINVLKKQR